MRKFEARVVSGIRWLAAVGVVAFLPTAAIPASTETADRGATVSWDVLDAVTTLSLDTAMLSNLGVETTVAGDRVSGHVKHPLSVIPDGAPSFAADVDSNLRGLIGWDGFRGFEEGSVLRHRGGLTLRRGSRTLDFADFELKAGARAGDLVFVDARGVASSPRRTRSGSSTPTAGTALPERGPAGPARARPPAGRRAVHRRDGRRPRPRREPERRPHSSVPGRRTVPSHPAATGQATSTSDWST